MVHQCDGLHHWDVVIQPTATNISIDLLDHLWASVHVVPTQVKQEELLPYQCEEPRHWIITF
jgi:hypothetical protein